MASTPLCLGCISPKLGALLIGALTACSNAALFWHISQLSVPSDWQDSDDGSRLQAESVSAFLRGALLWTLAASMVGVVGIYGTLTNHSRSLRLFALHGLIDTLVGFLVVASLSLLAFSTRISASVARVVCAEIVRGSGASEAASFFDFSRSAESCEERMGTVFSLVLAIATICVGFRAHCAYVCWRYYINVFRRNAFAREMQFIEVKPRRLSCSSTSSARTLRRTRSRSSTSSSSSSSEGTICASPTSSQSPRIFLLPASPDPSVPNQPTTAAKKPSRRHTAPPGSLSKDEVVVYAPVRMSMEEAARLGGRELHEPVWR